MAVWRGDWLDGVQDECLTVYARHFAQDLEGCFWIWAGMTVGVMTDGAVRLFWGCGKGWKDGENGVHEVWG